MKKKVLAVMLCLAVLFTGCSGKKNDTGNAAAGVSSGTETEAESASESMGEASSEGTDAGETETAASSEGTDAGEAEPETAATAAAEEDFDGEVVDGVFVIYNCMSEAEVIEVPAELGGVPVGVIGKNGFFQSGAKKIILPDTVTDINEYAFSYCASLEEIELGSGLKSVGISAFSMCVNLRTVSFPEGTEKLDCPFLCNDNLGEVYIPATVTDIPNRIGDPSTCPNLVIVTPAGSAAEARAKEDGLPVKNA